MTRRYTTALPISLHLVGWLPAVLCALGMLLFGLMNATIWQDGSSPVPAARVIEIFVPLAAGVQAAFALSPQDESCLELLLACPRPIHWALWERLLLIIVLMSCTALGGHLLQHEPLGAALVRWISPMIYLGGVAVFTTVLTRQGTFGALLATLLWGGMFFGGDMMLARWPYLWPLHAYLQPGDVEPVVYALNRTALILIGLSLIILASYLTRDEERLLGIRTPHHMAQ